MKDSTYATVIILNNQGAQYLQNGCFRKAAKSFHLALDTIKAAMEIDHTDDNDDSIENNAVTFEWSSEPRYLQNEDTEETFVYRRSLIIHPTHQPFRGRLRQESTAILYNLGLAYHLYGLEHNSNFLQTAVTFYEFALEMTETRMHDLFVLAVLNNLGQIHHEICDFEKSMQCFAHVFNELQCVSRPMDACDFKGFLLNLTLEAPSTAPSA
jgi:tetratricopeptide (TPR) repeat protein